MSAAADYDEDTYLADLGIVIPSTAKMDAAIGIFPAAMEKSPRAAEKPAAKVSGGEVGMTTTDFYDSLGLNWSTTPLYWGKKESGEMGKKGLTQRRENKSRTHGENATLLYCDGKILAVDFDDLTKEAALAVKAVCDAHPCGMVQKTGSGGFHYVYAADARIRSSVNKKVGFDTRTAKDVLICEPAAYDHPDGKRTYTWLRREGLVAPPEELIEILTGYGFGHTPKPPTLVITPAPVGGAGIASDDSEDLPLPPLTLKRLPADGEYAASLCECLTPEWLADTANWLKLCYALKNINPDFKDLMLETSKRAPGYNTAAHIAANAAKWDELKPSGRIGIGSLKHWAKRCNPTKYFADAKETYWDLIKRNNANAFCELFYNEMAGDIIYSRGHKQFYLYDEREGLWKASDSNATINFAFVEITTAVIRKIAAEVPAATTEEEAEKNKATQRMLEAARKYCDSKAVWLVQNFLPALCGGELDPANYFNQNADLLPLKNGVWRFSEKRLIPYEREHYFTFRIPVAYNPRADTTLIRQAVKDWFRNDADVCRFIQYYIGYCLTGETSRQQFLIAWGTKAGNGKSLLWGTILPLLLGDPEDSTKSYFHTLSSEALAVDTTGNNDDLYNLNGKRFAFLSEPRRTAKTTIDNDVLKNITGDKTYSAQAKYKNKITFRLQAKFVMACNDMPDLKFDDKGTNRRCVIAEQNTEFVDPDVYEATPEEVKASGAVKKKDDEMVKALIANTEGLMLWALEGASMWYDDPRMPVPAAMSAAKEKAVSEVDTLGVWLKGNLRNYKTLPVASRPADWERAKVKLSELKDIWKTKGLDFGQRARGFNKTFLAKAAALGFEVDEGRAGKSEEKIKLAGLIEDEEE